MDQLNETAIRAYAQEILDEATEYQASNADESYREMREPILQQFLDDGGSMAEWDEDDQADAWNCATMRTRLWDYGFGDQRLDALMTALRTSLETDDGSSILVAADRTRQYLVDGYADDEDLPTLTGTTKD